MSDDAQFVDDTDRVAPPPFHADEYVEYMDYMMAAAIIYLIGAAVAVFGVAKATATLVVTEHPGGMFSIDIVGYGPLWVLLTVAGVAIGMRGDWYVREASFYKQKKQARNEASAAFLGFFGSVVIKALQAAAEADSDE